jgi:hypothetical protein
VVAVVMMRMKRADLSDELVAEEQSMVVVSESRGGAVEMMGVTGWEAPVKVVEPVLEVSCSRSR